MEEENKELIAEVKEEDQEKFPIIDKELLLAYTKKFIKEDFDNIENYCYQWNDTNGKKFGSILPEDLIYNILELINEGRRKCYTKSYKHFKGSVYYHVKNELLTFFNCRKKDDITEDSPESLFTETKAESYFEEGLYADDAEDILKKIEHKELREAMLGLFDPNEEVFEISVLEEYFKSSKRVEIAESLKMTVDEVTNIQKRINRKIEKHFNKNLFEGIV